MSIDAKGSITRTGDIWNAEYTPYWSGSSTTPVTLFTPAVGEAGNVHLVTYNSSTAKVQYQVFAYVKTTSTAMGFTPLVDIGGDGETKASLTNASGVMQVAPTGSFPGGSGGSISIRTERFW